MPVQYRNIRRNRTQQTKVVALSEYEEDTPVGDPKYICPQNSTHILTDDQIACAPEGPAEHFDLCDSEQGCESCRTYCMVCGGCLSCNPLEDSPSLMYVRDSLTTEIKRRSTCGQKEGPRQRNPRSLDFVGVHTETLRRHRKTVSRLAKWLCEK